MSSNKRPIDWLGLPGLGDANKRPKSPAPPASSSTSNANQPQSTQTNTPQSTSFHSNPNHPSQATLPSTSPAQPGASVSGQGNRATHAMLSTLKSSMKILQKTGRIFPPLQSAADTLLEVLGSIEVAKQGNEKLRVATSDLQEWVVALSSYLDSSQPQQMSEDIEEQAKRIRDEQLRGRMKQVLESGRESAVLETCYRSIESSFRRLQESRLEGLKPAHDARYDSTFSTEVERGECLANTRVSVLEGIYAWIRDGDNTKIHWTNGMAGTGKTTIAYSICAGLERDGRLGASFFCARASPECRDVNRVLPTIAHQLAEQFHPFRSSLCRILGEQPSIGRRKIAVQFDYLVSIPMLEVKDLLPNGLVIVIDALDECSNPKALDMMLHALFNHAANLPVRFFLTSRPEPSITKTMLSRDNQSRSILHLHNVEEQFVKADIETYLTSKLASLSLESDQISQLAERAGILFIYAATVARYLLETDSIAYVSTRLQSILTQGSQPTTIITRDIDVLYKTILDGVFSRRLERNEMEFTRQVLWTVICAREPVTKGTLAILLQTDRSLVTAALQPLHSVLHVSESSEVVSTLHASFPEFLLSFERSVMLWCNEGLHSRFMVKRCFDVMAKQLRFNICRLETSSRYDRDVPDLDDRIEAFISAELAYACRHWSSHLCRSSIFNDLTRFLRELLEVRLLFWMEVLNLTGWILSAPNTLSETDEWLSLDTTISYISDLVKDAYSFATAFVANPIRQSTPHIYVSALAFYPKQSMVWRIYSKRMQGMITVDGTLAGQRDRMTRSKIDYKIALMAFSPDNSSIVFETFDEDIRICNSYTGIPLGDPFKLDPDIGLIYSIALSPDNSLLVTGHETGEVGVWYARNGAPFHSPFIGHTKKVSSVVFSPDGTQIASGSRDGTIRVWDVRNGILVCHPFDCHAGGINCVAFSPDSALVASACRGTGFRVWDIRSGSLLVPPSEGHTKPCLCVAFSPDGTRIVSGSGDGGIRIWDVCTGALVGEPLGGISPPPGFCSVAFTSDSARVLAAWDHVRAEVWDLSSGTLVAGSPRLDYYRSDFGHFTVSPNGARVAWFREELGHNYLVFWEARSGAFIETLFRPESDDFSVFPSADFTRIAIATGGPGEFCVLDSRTGIPIRTPLKVQSGEFRSLVFSPDGSRIISASNDRTVREWDVSSGIVISHPFSGIDTMHWDLTYSPDGTYLLAYGRDNIIRVWDMRHSRLVSALSPGHAITGIALSSDGAYVASCSRAKIVQVWDVHSGALASNPFNHSPGNHSWAPAPSIAFSPDNALIALHDKNDGVSIWEVHTSTLVSYIHTPKEHHYQGAAFLSDGSHIAVATSVGVYVCEVNTGTLVGEIMCKEPLGSIRYFGHLANDAHLGLVTRFLDSTSVKAVAWRFPVHSQPTSLLPRLLTINDDGWVVDPRSNSPIFWLPAELRGDYNHIATPNTLLILPSGTFSFDFSHVLIGDSWGQCYSS